MQVAELACHNIFFAFSAKRTAPLQPSPSRSMSEPGEQHNGDTRLPFCPFLRALGYEPFTYRCRLICTLVQSGRPNQSCVRHQYLHTNSNPSTLGWILVKCYCV